MDIGFSIISERGKIPDQFLCEFSDLRQLSTQKRFEIRERHFYPCLYDKTSTTAFDSHYVYHTAWAVRAVKKINPAKHIDISSSLYHDCGYFWFVKR